MNKNKVLIVIIDDLGPDELKRLERFFSFLLCKKYLYGILGYSFGALPTVLAGATPEEHGRMCLFSARQSGETNILRPLKWPGLLPRIAHECSRVRRVAEAKGRFEPGAIAGLASKMYVGISSRLHFLILASITLTPFIGINRESNTTNFTSQFQLPEIGNVDKLNVSR